MKHRVPARSATISPRVLWALFFIVAWAVLIGNAVTPKPTLAVERSTRRIAGQPFGICTHLDWQHFYKTENEVERALILLEKAGVQWIRVQAQWSSIEPQPGRHNEEQLKRCDYIVEEARRHGIQVYMLLVGTPSWASPRPDDSKAWTYAPTDLTKWSDFVTFVSNRYRSKVQYWEVNNEIDLDIFWRSGLEEYVKYLRSAYEAIKDVDKSNRVLLSGLATVGADPRHLQAMKYEENVLPRLYALGARRYFDIMSLHIYRTPYDIDQAVNHVAAAFVIMRANGDGRKPVWITETGLSTFENPSWHTWTESEQATYLVNLFPRLLGVPRVEKVFWYNFRCRSVDPKSQDDNYGIVNFDLTPRRAYLTYRDMVKSLGTRRNWNLGGLD